MNRRQFLALSGTAGMGILAGCPSSGGGTTTPTTTTETPTTTTQIPALELESAQQVVDAGVPQDQTRLALTVPDGVNVDVEQLRGGIELRAAVRDPVDDEVKPRSLTVSEAFVDGRRLTLTVEGPVSDGSEVVVTDGLSPLPAATTLQTGTTPTEAALWFKAYEPTADVREDFARGLYAETLNTVERASENPDIVLADLRRLLDLKVGKGMLSRERADEVLALWDDPTAREVFTSQGTFEPQLLAALLALAGTIGEVSIDAVLDGERSTGYPVKVRYEATDNGRPARVTRPTETGEVFVLFNPGARNERFEILSALMAHEAVHLGELNGGQNEEVIGNTIEFCVHAQQLLADPNLVGVRSERSRFANSLLLALLNSGRSAYPLPGVGSAPLHWSTPGIFPDGEIDYRDFETLSRQRYYSETPDVPTVGAEHIDEVIAALVGGDDQPDTVDYPLNRETVELLDAITLFSPEELFELLRILGLQLAE